MFEYINNEDIKKPRLHHPLKGEERNRPGTVSIM